MKREEFLSLKRGDIVQHVESGESYVIETITQHNGSYHFLSVRTCLITNPDEWKQVPSPAPPKFKIGDLVKYDTKIYTVLNGKNSMLTVQDEKGNTYLFDPNSCTPVIRIITPHTFESAVKAVAEKGPRIKSIDSVFGRIQSLGQSGLKVNFDSAGTLKGYSYARVSDWIHDSDNSPFGIVTYEEIT